MKHVSILLLILLLAACVPAMKTEPEAAAPNSQPTWSSFLDSGRKTHMHYPESCHRRSVSARKSSGF